MREKEFFIKYTFKQNGQGDNQNAHEVIYAIDLSEEINDGTISKLTYDEILDALRSDNILFDENNILIQSDKQWVQLDQDFEIDFQSDQEDWVYNEINLLLENISIESQLYDISQNVEKIQMKIEEMDTKQSNYSDYIINELDNKIKLSIDDIIMPSIHSKLIILSDQISSQMCYLLQNFQQLLGALPFQQPLQQEEEQNNNIQIQNNNLFINSSSQQDSQKQQQNEDENNNNINQNSPFQKQIQSSLFDLNTFAKNSGQNNENNETSNSLNPKNYFNFKLDDSTSNNNPKHKNSNTDEDKDNLFGLTKQQSLFGENSATFPTEFIKQDESCKITKEKISEKVGSIQNIGDEGEADKISKKEEAKPFQFNFFMNKNESEKEPDKDKDNSAPIFLFDDVEDSKENANNNENQKKNPISFQLPEEDGSDSPEIDFFKNVKPKKEITEDKIIEQKSSEAVAATTKNNPKNSNQINTSNVNSNNHNNSNNSTNNLMIDIPKQSTKYHSGALKSANHQSSQSGHPQNITLTVQPLNSQVHSINQLSGFSTNRNMQKSSMNNGGGLVHNNEKNLKQEGFSSVNGFQSIMKSSMIKNNNSLQFNQPGLTDSKFNLFEKASKENRVNSNSIYNSSGVKLISQTDMTIMYSDPLVKVSSSNSVLVPAGDPVDYELEIQKLNEFLNEANKQIKLDVVVASLDNLEKSITRNSQILHIMCHGDYSEKDQNYYLAFEDEESKLDTITSKRFQEFFKNKNSNVQLVFFNACHSEEVGKIFQEAGIPFVIAVQSDLKIEDRAALTFSSSFYMNIFSGHSVQDSFDRAKSTLQARLHENCFTCCCAHSHDDNCSWFIEAMNGFNQAHEMHKPDSRCKCPKAKKLYHEYTCQWAHEFLSKYRDDYEDIIENIGGGELFVCCCHTESTPHDESLKFRLIKNKNTEDCKLMENLPEGKIIQRSNFDFTNPIFQDQSKIFGRSLDIFKMYRCLMANQKLKTRFVGLNGELGSGKTAIAKKVARHLMERGQVNKIIIEDFEKMKTKITKFEQKMRLGQHTKELGYDLLKNNKALFILDNCDDLIKNNRSKFEEILNQLALNTPSKFIIISLNKHDLKLGQGLMLQVQLNELNELSVQQLLDFYAGEFIRERQNTNPYFNHQLQELLKIMPKSPKTIMETVQNFIENKDLSQILESFKSCTQSDKSKDFAAFNLLMKQITNSSSFIYSFITRELKAQNSKAYEMLLLISLFPHGVSVEDMKFLRKQKKIPHDWIDIMESLTMYQNESPTTDQNDQDQSDLPGTFNTLLKRKQSKKVSIFQPNISGNINSNNPKKEVENLEEDDFDNDITQEESYRFKKFKNGQYFWMSITTKFDIVIFKLKKFVIEQLKQQEFKEDIFPKEKLILQYLSTFSKRLLKHLRKKSLHQEKVIEYCSLSKSGMFGIKYIEQNQEIQNKGSSHQLSAGSKLKQEQKQPQQQHESKTNDNHSLGPRISSNLNQLNYQMQDDAAQSTSDIISDDDNEYNNSPKQSQQQPQSLQSFKEINRNSKKISHFHHQNADNIEQMVFKNLGISEIFKLHESNFYSYLNVEDHKQLIDFINSNKCVGPQKIKIKRNIQDLCVNIPSIHKLLDELSTCEEQCQQGEEVLNELLKNNSNAWFILAKSKLLLLKISLNVDRYIQKSNNSSVSNINIEDIMHIDEIDSINEEIDTKFNSEFDKNEMFTELLEIEKQFIVFFLLFQSYKNNKDNDQSHVFESILKINNKDNFPNTRNVSNVKQRVNQIVDFLLPELITKVQTLKKKDESIQDENKDIKFSANSLDILESKIHLLNGQIQLYYNKIYKSHQLDNLEKSINTFSICGLHNLFIQATIVYCKNKLGQLKLSRDSSVQQQLVKLKKDKIEQAIIISKQWKLTSLEADCKKVLGEINDFLHKISSNVFQFMKASPLMLDKNTTYGHIIRLNQSFKKRVTDVMARQNKELNLKFEIQTVTHFRECLQRGSKFMCISCDEDEEDGIVVEDDQLPLMRKYKESEMEDYYKQHYDEFGQIEILMICSPNGIKLKDMFLRIIEKVNQSILKMQSDNLEKINSNKSNQNKDNAYINGEEMYAEVSELRKIPTIIAFQFKPTAKKQNQPVTTVRAERRRQTLVKHQIHQQQQQQHIEKQESENAHLHNNELNHQNSQEQKQKNNASIQVQEDDEYDDFYLYYLKEFATQSFQFEFITQLLQDKPEPPKSQQQQSDRSEQQTLNIHMNHIKKAFNLANQKMITETINICSQDIKDEQTFENILGKRPELFFSDHWKDSKYEYRKGQIIDITSQRPPQNLNKNFLRISGRKQDIFILIQKIQENSVNIYGHKGIGKTILAEQVAYCTFSRNIFSDGVYYFNLKELASFKFDLKLQMEQLLGLQFSQDISEYFSSQKNILLIFDDFDLVLYEQGQQPKVKYFEYIFSYINQYNIHHILITKKSLRNIIDNNTISNNNRNNNNDNELSNPIANHLNQNMYFHEVKQLSKKESINFLDSLIDLDQINIKNVLSNRSKYHEIFQLGKGIPKLLIQEYCSQFGNPKIPHQFQQSTLQRYAGSSPPQHIPFPQAPQQQLQFYQLGQHQQYGNQFMGQPQHDHIYPQQTAQLQPQIQQSTNISKWKKKQYGTSLHQREESNSSSHSSHNIIINQSNNNNNRHNQSIYHQQYEVHQQQYQIDSSLPNSQFSFSNNNNNTLNPISIKRNQQYYPSNSQTMIQSNSRLLIPLQEDDRHFHQFATSNHIDNRNNSAQPKRSKQTTQSEMKASIDLSLIHNSKPKTPSSAATPVHEYSCHQSQFSNYQKQSQKNQQDELEDGPIQRRNTCTTEQEHQKSDFSPKRSMKHDISNDNSSITKHIILKKKTQSHQNSMQHSNNFEMGKQKEHAFSTEQGRIFRDQRSHQKDILGELNIEDDSSQLLDDSTRYFTNDRLNQQEQGYDFNKMGNSHNNQSVHLKQISSFMLTDSQQQQQSYQITNSLEEEVHRNQEMRQNNQRYSSNNSFHHHSSPQTTLVKKKSNKKQKLSQGNSNLHSSYQQEQKEDIHRDEKDEQDEDEEYYEKEEDSQSMINTYNNQLKQVKSIMQEDTQQDTRDSKSKNYQIYKKQQGAISQKPENSGRQSVLNEEDEEYDEEEDDSEKSYQSDSEEGEQLHKQINESGSVKNKKDKHSHPKHHSHFRRHHRHHFYDDNDQDDNQHSNNEQQEDHKETEVLLSSPPTIRRLQQQPQQLQQEKQIHSSNQDVHESIDIQISNKDHLEPLSPSQNMKMFDKSMKSCSIEFSKIEQTHSSSVSTENLSNSNPHYQSHSKHIQQ